MQIYPILLVAVVMAADPRSGLTLWGEGGAPSWAAGVAAALGPLGLILFVQWVVTRRLDRLAAAGAGPRALLRADRAARWARTLIVLNHAVATLVFGWVDAVRGVVGDLVLIDEVVAIAPPLAGLLATWWVAYPVERRLREALLLRWLDDGQPVYALPTRWRYVILQGRIQLLLLLAPVLLIAGLSEAVSMLEIGGSEGSASAAWIPQVSALASALLVFLFAPLLARVLLDVRPLAPGPLRDELMAITRRHRVRVRLILLWNTSGMMINAAVMGLIAPLRYVLLTDALVETMSRPQLHAVMAHEIGHVRRHHMPWLVVCLLATLMLSGLIIETPLFALSHLSLPISIGDAPTAHLVILLSELALGLTMFGWVCRRFERQADTFAVQHLSTAVAEHADAGVPEGATGTIDSGNPTEPRVTREAVQSMHSALDAIARLNAVSRHRPSWRHGSIAWRQEYLHRLIGRPLAALPIDRHVRWIKIIAAAVLALGIGATMLESSRTSAAPVVAASPLAGVGAPAEIVTP